MDAESVLEGILASMTLENNFWGYLFSRIKKIPKKDLESIMGVAYNDKNYEMVLYYRPESVEKTEQSVLLKVLEHEGTHLLNKHPSRTNKCWSIEKIKNVMSFPQFLRFSNIAADLAVNTLMNMPEILMIEGKETKPWLPKSVELPEKMSYEFYYAELRKKLDEMIKSGKIQMNNCECEHYWLDPNAPDGEASAQRMEMATYKLVKDAVKVFNKSSGRGNLPGYLQELINGILIPPALPYYQMIAKMVKGTRLSKYKRSPVKINRKRLYCFMENMPELIPFPGKKRDKTFYLGLLIDTSGSRSAEDIMEDLSAIKDVIENDPYCYVTAVQVDTEVKDVKTIKKLTDIEKFDVKGRGGTTLGPGLEKLKQIGVDIVLAFTDGYCENMNIYQRNHLPRKIVWCIPERNGSEECVKGIGPVVRIPNRIKRGI